MVMGQRRVPNPTSLGWREGGFDAALEVPTGPRQRAETSAAGEASQRCQARRRRFTLSCVSECSSADWTVAVSSSLSFS